MSKLTLGKRGINAAIAVLLADDDNNDDRHLFYGF